MKRTGIGFRMSVFAALVASPGVWLTGAEVRDCAWFLRRLADLDRLPFSEPGVVSRQFSGYHRASRYDRETQTCVGMDVNGDSGHVLSVHAGPEAAAEFAAFGIPAATPRVAFGDLEWVLDPLERNHVFFFPRPAVENPAALPPGKLVAAIRGPGCILRLWSADPQGLIRFYLDGSTTPLEFDFRSLFVGGATDPDEAALARRAEWPFLRPFTFRRAGDQDRLASDCYLPIPFARSCLVALSRPAFYHIGYQTFPEGTPVETFRLPLPDVAVAAYDEVRGKLLGRGADPKPPRPGTVTIERTIEIAPGGEAVLAELTGPRTVTAFQARLTGHERYAHSKVLVTAHFDDEPGACVWAPLVNLFGTGFEPRDYRSLPLGFVDGEGYCYFPMPFRRRGRFAVRNEGTRGVTLAWRLAHAPAPDLPPDTMLFKAKYRREPVCTTFDYPFLDCRGRGRFVGTSLCIDDAWRSWWGEGDEKIWVDDDRFPSFFGTGSEDFFGDAWGIRTLHESFFACSFVEHNRDHAWTCCYRWMIPDDVPFTNRFRGTIENYPETLWGPVPIEWDEDYVSVAYWYQEPGGSDFFEPVPVSERRPWGKVPAPPLVEAEAALAPEILARATVLSDDDLQQEFSRGAAVDLGRRDPGDSIVLTGPELSREGPYAIVVHTLGGIEDAAPFAITIHGEEAGRTPQGYGKQDSAALGMAVLPPGRSVLELTFTGPGRAVLDCIQLRPARNLREVREAEGLRIVAPADAEPLRPVGVLWSGGRQLRLPASGPGVSYEVEVPLPRGEWCVGVGLTRGPEYGTWEVRVEDEAARLLRGYASSAGVLDYLPAGSVVVGGRPVRLRLACVGKDTRAEGYDLGLDYVSWRPILVRDALEGELAEVVDIRNGQRTDQLLGSRFSGGNHLWFHPANPDAGFTWLLDVPADGNYDLAVYFTKSWDYAIVRLSLDGTSLGEFDTYAPAVTWGGKTPLGTHALTRGIHRLTFDVAGRNEQSKGILIGVDCLTLQPVGR
ncbi:MAG: DUF2961 domain-containing protein [Lentisphaeria bacterium]|nr:DUF2961 domain-containing protein [Lentisphaeria bacterium]